MSRGPGRTRTDDTRGVSAVLYQLSYRPLRLGAGSSQLRDGLPVRGQRPRLPRPVDHSPAQDAGAVDEEGAADGGPDALVEDVVGAGDLAVRPEVGQQRELVLLLLRPGTLAVHGVARDADELDVRVLEHSDVVPELAQLSRADPGERERVADQGKVPLAGEVPEPQDLAVLVLQREIRRLHPDPERHENQCGRSGRSRNLGLAPAALGRRQTGAGPVTARADGARRVQP